MLLERTSFPFLANGEAIRENTLVIYGTSAINESRKRGQQGCCGNDGLDLIQKRSNDDEGYIYVDLNIPEGKHEVTARDIG